MLADQIAPLFCGVRGGEFIKRLSIHQNQNVLGFAHIIAYAPNGLLGIEPRCARKRK